MAHMTFVNAFFSWNSVDLSTHVREIHLRSTHTFVEDANTMGDTGRRVLPVLEDYELEIVFSADFAAAQIDATLGPDKLAKTPRAFEIRPDAAVVGATNPKYTGTGYIETYEPISGAFGEVLGSRITIVPSVAGLTRAIV